MKLKIEVRPRPSEIPATEMDALLEQSLTDFEQDFDRRCKEKGLPSGAILSSEKSIVKAYVLFMSTTHEEEE